jgi:hypothetical protein
MLWYICGSHSGYNENYCLVEFDVAYSGRYKLILKERSIVCEMIVLVIVRKKFMGTHVYL